VNPTRVVVTNTVSLNSGDAAILYSLIAAIREAYGNDTDVTIYDSQAPVARRLHPALTFQSHLHSLVTRSGWPWPQLPQRWNARRLLAGGGRWGSRLLNASEQDALRPWRAAEVIVSSGGTYLVEQYDLAPRILDFRMAMRLGKPLVLFTQSLGAFRDPVSRAELKEVLEYASLILVREQESLDNLRALGVSTERTRVVADAAFALADLPALARARERTFPERGARIAVSVREWPYFKTKTQVAGMADYSEAVAALVRHLVSKGHRVTFLSTCQGVPEYWTDDSATAKRILEGRVALGEQVAVDSRFRTPTELIAELGTFDAVVATRMHAGILALSAGTPVLAIDYEDKARRLFGQLGVPDWSVDIESASPSLLCQAWDTFASGVDARRAALFEAVTAKAKDARTTAGLLRSAIAGGPGGTA
jgi:colanic acid/amylovoran biosynthesis protein